MKDPVTIGGLLLTLGSVIGLAAACIGALMVFAAGMSDAPDDGTSGRGCVVTLLGMVLLIGCIAGLVL